MPTGWVDSVFSLILAGVIVVSLQILGVTMIAAAIVIPPVAARLLTNDFGKMVISSMAIGSFCGLGGLYVSYYIDVSSGPSVVLFSAVIFFIALGYSSLKEKLGKGSINRQRRPGRHGFE